jgi:signal transduction histidine kinase/Ni2+-binding GTPase involved in maturation of urease and hydrogenase
LVNRSDSEAIVLTPRTTRGNGSSAEATTTVHVVGGFLGAGKTRAVSSLARQFAERGETVAVVTNDQGHPLVDTQLVRSSGAVVREIGGGCICCRYPELEDALLMAADKGVTVAFVEAVGSCTDLVATVLAPMADRYPDRFRLAPLSVVVDPWRVLEMSEGAFAPDQQYLFRKQIEEADVVVLSRLDLAPPDVRKAVAEINRDAAVVAVSSVTGEGLSAWLAARPARPASPLAIDYDRYAAAEASLGWLNGVAVVESTLPFRPASVVRKLFGALHDLPVVHFKVAVLEPATGASAALVRRNGEVVEDLDALPAETRSLKLLVNARVAAPAQEVEHAVRGALAAAAAPGQGSWEGLECFEPSRPSPVYRYAHRIEENARSQGASPRNSQKPEPESEQLRHALEREAAARKRAEEAERRSSFLAGAYRTLSSSLDYESTLAQVAALAVPAVADFCAVYVGDAGAPLRPLAVAYFDEQASGLAREFAADYARCVTLPDSPGVCSVLQTRSAGTMDSEQVGPPDQCCSYRELAQRLSLSTSIAVPLVAREHPLGVVLFAYRSSRRNLDPDLALAQDLAARAALAVDNARLYMEAQTAIRLRDEFLTVASHELRTPVTSIMFAVELLQRLTAGPSLTSDSVASAGVTLRRLDRQSRHLEGLIDRLLDVGRIQSGHWKLDLEPHVDLAAVTRDATTGLLESAARSGCAIELHAEQNGITGTFDRTRIVQLVCNLVNNALRYGAGHPVEVTVDRTGHLGRIVVRDRGIGIAPEAQAEIFEPYKRATSSRHYPGLGLGLYIVRQIVLAHGGDIHVDSALGAGATFIAELPCDAA